MRLPRKKKACALRIFQHAINTGTKLMGSTENSSEMIGVPEGTGSVNGADLHHGRSFSNWLALRMVSWRSRLLCSSEVLMAERNREWSSSGSEINLKGCSSHDNGVNISAAARTDPADVKNMSLPVNPCRIGRCSDNSPPVTETTLNCPEARLPSARRKTAGIVSENRTRSARRGA